MIPLRLSCLKRSSMKKILVSACLLGCACRYDGASKPCEKVIDLAKDNVLIPICPEQMGGLTTPRNPSERQPGKDLILMNNGTDVTAAYKRGVEAALNIAKINNIDYAILKSGSPSCGHGLIYDGSFSGKKIPGNGITADALIAAGYKVFSEEEI